MDIAGHRFEVEALQPFGERWVPKKGPVDMDAFLIEPDIEHVVEATRNAGVVIVENTFVNPHWVPKYQHPNQDIAHAERGPAADSVTLTLDHSADGSAIGSGYAKHGDLFNSANRLLQDLRDIVRSAPEYVVQRYRLEQLLEQYGRFDGFYSFGELEGFSFMPGDIEKMHGQLTGMRWESGQDLKAIRRELPQIERSYAALTGFFRKVTQGASAVRHSWEQHPKSTVLAYQSPVDRFEDPSRVVFQFRLQPYPATEKRALVSDVVLEGHFGHREKFHVSYSKIRERRGY